MMAIPTIVTPGAPNRRRLRCHSCSSDVITNSFEDNSPYLVPEYISRRNRTNSICGRIQEEPLTGTVKYFCRSRGHGFIIPDKEIINNVNADNEKEVFMHISDIESEVVPRAGDKVSYRLCPVPPKFDKHQAVDVHITSMSSSGEHKSWDTPSTPEELAEDNNYSPAYDV